MNTKKLAIQKVRDATDASGGAKFPNFMLANMKGWEREGLLEIHHLGHGAMCARITEKGREYASALPKG